MLLNRLPDGTPIFEDRLDRFRDDWRAAPQERRLILNDGRPAVRLPNGSLTTVFAPLWEAMRGYMDAALAGGLRPRKRERLCQACGGQLTVTREFERAWTFTCDVCKSTEIHGKSLVGGTEGAGEKEKT